MTIFDLKWLPASIGEGMVAVHEYENGITADLRFEHDAYNFTSFRSDRRVLENRQGLSREEVNRLLSATCARGAFNRA